MTNPLTGFICACLLVVAGNLPGRAQEKSPNPQPAIQAAPPVVQMAIQTTAPADSTAPQQTAAPAEATAPPVQAPAEDAQPPQQTNPPQQAPPAGQTPPPNEDQPTQHGILPVPPPPPPKIPDVRRPGESGFWVGIQGWFPKQQPIFNRANQSTFVGSSLITMQGTPKYAEVLEVGAAVGLHNTLRFTATNFNASGDFTTPVALVAWAEPYTAGTYISTNYKTQSLKLSYEYLTWPYPVGSKNFRLKTLWQVQYTSITSTFDSPLDYYDTNGNLILDTSGNPANFSASRTVHIFSPMLGLGGYYYPSRHFRLEVNGSGFGWPHRYDIFDTDVSLNIRVIPHFELRLGGRAFGFKTSTNSDYYLHGIFANAFVGLRWYSNSE